MFKLSTHSGRLERWLGKEQVERISLSMRGSADAARWYGKPIAVSVPGRVYVGADGDFRGRLTTGLEASVLDVVASFTRRFRNAARAQETQLNSGFAGLGGLISAATQPTVGSRRMYPFVKVGSTAATTNQTSSLWQSGSSPAAGGAASAAPGGRIPTSTTTGAFPFANPSNPQTQHYLTGFMSANVAACSLLLYDRIFDVAKTMSSSATEAVTGTPTRYTSTTGGAVDSAENNFLFVEIQTTLSSTAHNWTVCKYTSQNGTTNQTIPSITGNSAGAAQRLDHPNGFWFAPLATGDTGLSALTQMQCSSAALTGAINFVMGHPIGWMTEPIVNQIYAHDGVTTAFNFERIFDNACLAFLEPIRPTNSACTYTGTFHAVTG